MRKLVSALFFLLVIAIAAFFYNRYRIAPKIDFAAVTLTNLEGKPVAIDDFKDKKRFINFFATWCGPCMNEMPAMDKAASDLKNEDFVFICISDEPIERLMPLHERVPSLVILHSNKKFKEIGIFSFPTSYVLDSKGDICFKKYGEMDFEGPGTIKEIKLAGK
ncbi:MAG: thiol:disulfide interchange protein TlpA [Bacteroidota bacterium]|nr:thiol:disulfide interchange protein TlpA [Bacteroidota bacterium]